MPTVYLARHATPDWSVTDIPYHIPPGPPLIEQGESEAAALGQFLRLQGVKRIFVSPLERCQATAQIAAAAAGARMETVEGLREWQPGEGRELVTARFLPAFETAYRASTQAGPVAMITHGGPIGLMLVELGMDPQTLKDHRLFDHNNPLPPGGAWEASRTAPDGPWNLRLAFVPGEVI